MTDLCGTCGHGHATDLRSLNASACADHSWTDACPYSGTACPPAVERADISNDLSRRYDAQLLRKCVDWQAEIARWERKIAEVLPARIEPIKLTPGQWAMLPHRAPNPYGPLTSIGDLFGVPVVMVNAEDESTPVAEGWIKPNRRESRRERRKRLGLHWWQRSRS